MLTITYIISHLHLRLILQASLQQLTLPSRRHIDSVMTSSSDNDVTLFTNGKTLEMFYSAEYEFAFFSRSSNYGLSCLPHLGNLNSSSGFSFMQLFIF